MSAQARHDTGSIENAHAALDRGEVDAARSHAREALARAPRNADALCVAGIAEMRAGESKQAESLLRRALRIDPAHAQAHHALGNSFHESGQLELAVSSYRRALRIDQTNASAHNDLGAALYDKGRIGEAITEFEAAARLDADNPTAYENLGSALRRLRRFGDARRAYTRGLWLRIKRRARKAVGLAAKPRIPADEAQRAAHLASAMRLYHARDRAGALAIAEEILAHAPEYAEALHIKGLCLVDGGRAEDGLPVLQHAVRVEPDIAEFHNSLGSCLLALHRPVEALDAYRQALQLSPALAQAHSNVAAICIDQDDFVSAERASREAMRLDPELILARINLARALIGQGRYAESEAAAREAARMAPKHVGILATLGQALREQGRLAAALQVFNNMIAADPGNVDAHLSIGSYYQDCERDLDRAIEHYRIAQELNPREQAGRFNESLVRLMRGEFSRETWDLYEARQGTRRRAIAYRKLTGDSWDGTPAPGKSMLLYGEQGIGDEIMFASMVAEAGAGVGACTLASDPRLQPLFARSFPSVKCVGWSRAPDATLVEGMDFVMPVGSLGRLLRTDSSRFARHRGYLRADDARVSQWRDRLRALGPGPHIGLAWRGGMFHSGRSRRSVPVDELATSLAPMRATWISLQMDATAKELGDAQSAAGMRIHAFPEKIADVEETAALIAALDGVVSVCSWIVHLAGALGRPVEILAPFVPEWRYGIAGATMPWYPSAHVLRQPSYGNWPSVLHELPAQLAGRIGAAAP